MDTIIYKARVLMPSSGGFAEEYEVKRVYASSEKYYLLTLLDGRQVHVPIQYTIIEELEEKDDG